MNQLTGIRGSSNSIRFIFDDDKIKGSGEFFAVNGEVNGFVVSTGSLKHEDGKFLSKDEVIKLKAMVNVYSAKRRDSSTMKIEWD